MIVGNGRHLDMTFALFATVLFCGATMAATAAPEGILIIHSNQRPTPAQVIIDDTLRAVVPQELNRPVNIFSEYLDAEWTSLQTYGLAQAEFLREKYGPRNISIIVADALPALRFEMEFRDRMFPGVPIVYLSVAVDRVDRTALPSDVVGVLEDYDPTPTLQLALRLHPDARRLVFIRGEDQHFRFRRVGADLPGNLDAVDDGQHGIDDGHVGIDLRCLRDRISPVVRLGNDLPTLVALQNRFQADPDHLMMVRDQDP